jgi:hypothetical protein
MMRSLRSGLTTRIHCNPAKEVFLVCPVVDVEDCRNILDSFFIYRHDLSFFYSIQVGTSAAMLLTPPVQMIPPASQAQALPPPAQMIAIVQLLAPNSHSHSFTSTGQFVATNTHTGQFAAIDFKLPHKRQVLTTPNRAKLSGPR